MKAYTLRGPGLAALSQTERPQPSPGAREVLIEVEAVSLNYRDLAVIQGALGRLVQPVTPLSDMAGRIVALGAGVKRFRVGDRVSSNFIQDWHRGPLTSPLLESCLFLPRDGVLAQYVTVPEDALVGISTQLSPTQACTLPIAGVTAWNALKAGSRHPGSWVLIQGTGGVSIFALQVAKALGLHAIVISSSDDKLARAAAMGADATINYRTCPDWAQSVLDFTGGSGVDLVIEVGGAATFVPSIRALALNGVVASVGFVSGQDISMNLYETLIGKKASLVGIRVGSRCDFEELVAFMTLHSIEPIVDRVFGFDQTRHALEYLAGGGHFGKVVIDVSGATTQ